MLKIINVVGARPNFMKVAPIVEAMRRRADEFAPLVVHTGQHYDAAMSDTFFRDLQLPAPDIHLEVGSGSHAAQTALVMQRFEPILLAEKPDWVIVVGDVNSTLACALVCAKLGVRVAHVEAGLRSRDRTMPEEVNRVLTDQISDLLLTPSRDADENLRREGIPAERIRCVGNVMIDSLRANLERAVNSDVRNRFKVAAADYAVVTLHRPSNVDDEVVLKRIFSALDRIAGRLPVIFPVHPRTRASLEQFRASEIQNADQTTARSQIKLIEPLGYLDFLRLYSGARLVLTDSGGIQEETTWLGIPCLTLRENTERPITIEMGTNKLVGTDAEAITREAFAALEHSTASAPRPQIPLWDGRAAPRVLEALLEASKS
ncbi:MAG: UDP-N-acetylglucosamine 2-epimerase (non-hydrolyzing) [Pyrinomonadaceae bacterium]|nr:UDP-N-acetylglucosamine 2-epimerase (non-hydrolyzing) [Pyrinomonadaceae bacterium]